MGAFVLRNGSAAGGFSRPPAQILRGRARVPTAGFEQFLATGEALRQAQEIRRTIAVAGTTSLRKKAAGVAAGGAIVLAPTAPRAPGAVGGTKLASLDCQARGGTMMLGRCIVPGPQGGADMGLRAQLIADGFLPTGGPSLLGGLVQGGLDILGSFVASKFGTAGVPSPSPTPLAVTTLGGLIPTGGPVGLAAVSGAIVAAGGAIVGSVIRISSAAWRAIPTLVKQAAVALGLTVAFTDVGVADVSGLFGGGDRLSQAQQRKIAKFQAMTSAGVPPGIAARATGIGRKRRRGISAFELSGFRKISHLLGHVGMVPRGLRGARAHRGHHHK